MLNRAVSYIRTEEGQKEPKGSGGKLKWFHERRPGREQRARRAGGGLRGREAARSGELAVSKNIFLIRTQ